MIQTPSTFSEFSGFPVNLGIDIQAEVSAHHLWVRCISLYLSGANDAPDFWAQERQVSWILSSVQQFLWVDGLQTTRYVSSMKPRLA